MNDTEPRCAGLSAHGPCGARPMYETVRHSGKPPRAAERKYACGRHIAWLLRYRTVPGTIITVTRLEKSLGS